MRKLLGKLGGAIAGPLLRAATLLLLFSSAFCHAQDISCINDVPTISSITPDTWIAGQTTAVTITGANFCPSQGGIAISDDNGDYPVTYFTINSTTQITFNASPLASDPPATITIWVEDCADACGYTAKTTAQIVQCPPSLIASVLPRTWFAGESYPIKITGKNFMPTVPSGCPAPQVSVSPNGADPGLSGVTVVSDTEIDATVKPDASATTGIAVLQIGNPVHTAVKGQILGNQIMFNGNVISTTDGSDPPVQNVVVGQQIVLTPTMPLTTYYDGATTPQPWTLPATPANIGGYSPTTAGASVTPTTLTTANNTAPQLTTYWPYAGSNIPVSFKYCVNINGANPVLQCSLPANAAFTVTGPTGSAIATTQSVMVTPQQIPLCDGTTTTAQLLVFGANIGPGTCKGPGNTGGFAFKGSNGITIASPVSSSNGSLEWIQVITANQFTETSPGASTPTSYDCGEGLDNAIAISLHNKR